jgi:hypothetical protein
MTTAQPRRGRTAAFAVLAVLSILLALVPLAAVEGRALDFELSSLASRIDDSRLYWTAVGCSARAQETMRHAAHDAADPSAWTVDRPWPIESGDAAVTCVASWRHIRGPWALQQRPLAAIAAELHAAGLRAGQGDSVAQALMDWSDADASALPLGAEREWYRAQGRLSPRNGDIAHADELLLVRGVDRTDIRDRVASALDRLLHRDCAGASRPAGIVGDIGGDPAAASAGIRSASVAEPCLRLELRVTARFTDGHRARTVAHILQHAGTRFAVVAQEPTT